jgi:hypothetical protein
MSGKYPEPKLIEESKYDSTCALCTNEIPKGAPLWWFNQNCYCMEHTKAEIKTEGPEPTNESAPVPSPSTAPVLDSVTSKFWMSQVDLIIAAIDRQTRVWEGMRKDNNERR